MADIDLKIETPDASIDDSAVLFGADSQASASPSVYAVSTLRGHIAATANTFSATQTFTPAVNTSALVGSGYSLTGSASASFVDLSGTWNTSGTPTAIKLNITNTASTNGLLISLARDGASQFAVTTGGDVRIRSGVFVTNTDPTSSTNTARVFLGTTGQVWTGSSGQFAFGSSSDVGNSPTIDTILTRRAAANLRLGAADAAASATVTITIASPGVVTWNNHGLSTGTPVIFSTTGALPTGITAGTTYYAIVVDGNTFRIATSFANALAGTAVNTSGSQSGTHTGARGAIDQTLSVQSVVAGTTNFPGADFVISGSQGTGTGAGGSIVFQVAPAGSSGTAQNALATALTIASDRRLYGDANTSIGMSGGFTTIYTYGVTSLTCGSQVQVAQSLTISATAAPCILIGDAANTLALRNGTAAQEFRVYNTTDGTNSEYLAIKSTTGGAFEIGPRRTGTGAAQNGVLNATNATGTGVVTCLSWGSFGSGFLQTSVGFSSAAADTYDLGATSGNIGGAFRRLFLAQFIETKEMTAPAAPSTNGVRIYAEDNGSGKTRLMALFATGVAQQIAIEP